jgi:hypothetical protein
MLAFFCMNLCAPEAAVAYVNAIRTITMFACKESLTFKYL